MKIILLSGGAGKRLWPLSNEARAKQFLKVLAGPNGPESMLQRMWRQLGAAALHQDTFVCSSASQADVIQSQIGDVRLIREPQRRDTFPAISLAALYLSAAGHPDSEIVTILPVDSFVDDTYFDRLQDLQTALERVPNAHYAVLGAAPSGADTKFGYIVSDSPKDRDNWRPVRRFVEKPSPGLASLLVSRGALWNCGVVCTRLGTIKRTLRDMGVDTDRSALEVFADLPAQSFDKVVLERSQDIIAVPYKGAWKDLGTWDALTADMAQPGKDHVIINSPGTSVINELSIPLLTVGVTNAVIVATPDGILVADKAQAAGIKGAVPPTPRPMYEERRWGSYTVVDYRAVEGGLVLTKHIEVSPGRNLSYQKHMKRAEVWAIVEGTGEMALNGRIYPVRPGDTVYIQAEQWHAIRAAADHALRFIEVQRGTELTETDIVRQFRSWDEIETACNLEHAGSF